MARTRLSPMCWATSATTVMVCPSTSISNSRAQLISGRESRGNSPSTTGPMTATIRPSLYAVVGSSAVVLTALLCLGLLGPDRLILGKAFSATDDLHDLGRDGVLASPVGLTCVVFDQVAGVVGRRLHGPLSGDVLGGG